MSKNHIALAALALVTAGLSGNALADFNANIEFDNTYRNNDRGLSQGGRVELNAVGKVSPNYFVAGKASFLALKNGGVSTDDMWVQMGSNTVDVKLGRFEATDLFPLGRDTIVEHSTRGAGGLGLVGTGSVYLGNTLRGRTGGDIFHGALNFKPVTELTAELGVVETRTADASKGLRPVVTYETGPIRLRAGVESIRYVAGPLNGAATRETGVGLTGKYNFGPTAINLNYAQGKNSAGNEQKSFGVVFSDSALGGGLIISRTADPAPGDYEVKTGYITYAMPLFDIKGATITTALLASQAGGTNPSPNDKALRVRINYAF